MQEAHCALPFVVQAVPFAPFPLLHVHCLSAPHTALAALLAAEVVVLPSALQSVHDLQAPL